MKDLPEGTRVRVTSHLTGHRFETNEIVVREKGEHDFESDSVAFVSECGEEKWYMVPEEYEIVSYPDGYKSDADKSKNLKQK